jgi:hypothetical protein
MMKHYEAMKQSVGVEDMMDQYETESQGKCAFGIYLVINMLWKFNKFSEANRKHTKYEEAL